MSLVGPRPALPSEVAEFDSELRQRETILPGITGLWQVEAGECADFEAYRRLDLFYVDNWSVGMDLTLMLSTVGVLIGRTVRTLRGGREATGTVGSGEGGSGSAGSGIRGAGMRGSGIPGSGLPGSGPLGVPAPQPIPINRSETVRP
jgi:hypothetical protein